jgi:chorismate mutase
MEPIDRLRAEIDRIDDALITLLKERIGVVAKVGELKRAQGQEGLFIRSGREGQMHRRIAEAFAGTAYPPQAMLGIWRLLITASTHHESPLNLGLLASGAEDAALPALAVSYFGDFLERRSYSNAGSLLADLADGRIRIGIVPSPENDAGWWLQLAQYRQAGAHIFARLPIMQGRRQDAKALALGIIRPEASGEDESYVALKVDDSISTSKLHGLFDKVGLKAQFINAALQPPLRWALVKITGFVDGDAQELKQLQTLLGQGESIWLGAHPAPIENGEKQ